MTKEPRAVSRVTFRRCPGCPATSRGSGGRGGSLVVPGSWRPVVPRVQVPSGLPGDLPRVGLRCREGPPQPAGCVVRPSVGWAGGGFLRPNLRPVAVRSICGGWWCDRARSGLRTSRATTCTPSLPSTPEGHALAGMFSWRSGRYGLRARRHCTGKLLSVGSSGTGTCRLRGVCRGNPDHSWRCVWRVSSRGRCAACAQVLGAAGASCLGRHGRGGMQMEVIRAGSMPCCVGAARICGTDAACFADYTGLHRMVSSASGEAFFYLSLRSD
ncbi:hypothetical protein Ddep01_00903 [Deinococcus depolymerans]